MLQSLGAGVYERARYCSEWVNERISDSSEYSDVSERLIERAQGSLMISLDIPGGSEPYVVRLHLGYNAATAHVNNADKTSLQNNIYPLQYLLIIIK